MTIARDGMFRRVLVGLGVATAMLAGTAANTTTKIAPSATGKLAGWLLVASPSMPDPRFAQTVIFMLRHSQNGAMGLIVNRPIAVEPAEKVLERVVGKREIEEPGRPVRIQYGGPVQTSHGFFMHTSDYADPRTVSVTAKVSLTSSQDILRALARGKGPTKGFLAMGYAGWGAGQLEREIRRKDWVTVYPDDGIIFDDDIQSKWQRAMNKRGADL